VGRILSHLKRQGQLIDPPRSAVAGISGKAVVKKLRESIQKPAANAS